MRFIPVLFVLVIFSALLTVVVGKVAPLLPPPDSAEKGEGGEDEETARGLKGQANPLASLQKSHAKCTVEGMYGIKNECSKYIDCAKKGNIPATKFCPSGKFFDHLKRLCVKSGDAQCQNTCPKDGHEFADPMDDKGFLKCAGGVPLPHQCPAGQKYSKEASKCK